MSWKVKLGIGFAGLLALLLLLLVVEHFRGKWGLARWKARMAAKGEPLTIAAVTAPLPSMDENRMPALNIAAGQVGRFPYELLPRMAAYAAPGKVVVITRLGEWRGGGRRGKNVTWEALDDELSPREPALKSAIEALRHPKFNSALDYHSGWSTRLPHLSWLRYLQLTLTARALHQFHGGKTDEGFEFLLAGIRMPGTLEDEAFTISQLVRLSMAEIAFYATWQAVHTDGLSDGHLQRLQEAWAEQDFLKPMRRALSMEHAVTSHEFRRVRESDISVDQWTDGTRAPPTINSPIDFVEAVVEETPYFFRSAVYTPLWKFAWSYQDELRYVKTVERGLNLWDAAVAQQSAVPLQILRNAEYRGLAEHNPALDQNLFGDMRYILSPRAERFFPAMKPAFSAQTLRELAIAGVALKQYELRHGRPAATLESLVPEFLERLPHDFMDGKPLKYKVGSEGPVLYSVGGDSKDDGADAAAAVLIKSILDGKDYVWPRPASDEEATAWLANERPE